MNLSRRGFLGFLGASTAAASAVSLPFAGCSLADKPPINRKEYYVYEWNHVLGFMDNPDALIKDTGEWGVLWRDKVRYDRSNQEVLVPKLYKDGQHFWAAMPDAFIKRWLHMQAINTGKFIRSQELDRAMFSNPSLFKLALRWKKS